MWVLCPFLCALCKHTRKTGNAHRSVYVTGKCLSCAQQWLGNGQASAVGSPVGGEGREGKGKTLFLDASSYAPKLSQPLLLGDQKSNLKNGLGNDF